MKFAYCLSIVVVIGKYTDIFRGWGIVLGLDFYGRILWREVSGGTGEFSRENFTLRGFDGITIRSSF